MLPQLRQRLPEPSPSEGSDSLPSWLVCPPPAQSSPPSPERSDAISSSSVSSFCSTETPLVMRTDPTLGVHVDRNDLPFPSLPQAETALPSFAFPPIGEVRMGEVGEGKEAASVEGFTW